MWMVTRSRSASPAAITTQTNKLHRRYAVLGVCLGICLLVPHHALAQTTIPDTPAGHVLRAWLDAFNSGDRAALESYLKTYDPKQSLDFMLNFRGQTGGFELLGVDKSEPSHIEFRVKEKASPATAAGSIDLKTADPVQVGHFSLRAIPAGMTAADMHLKIDAATRTHVIDGAIAALDEYYVYPETAKKMEDALRARQKKGDYDKVADADAFAMMLTDNLQEVSHDKHLRVNFSPRVLPMDDANVIPRKRPGCAPDMMAIFAIGRASGRHRAPA